MYAINQRLLREMEDSVLTLDLATYQMEDAAQWPCALQHRAMCSVFVGRAILEVALVRLDVFRVFGRRKSRSCYTWSRRNWRRRSSNNISLQIHTMSERRVNAILILKHILHHYIFDNKRSLWFQRYLFFTEPAFLSQALLYATVQLAGQATDVKMKLTNVGAVLV